MVRMAIFEFSVRPNEQVVHSLSLGDLTITGNVGSATSKDNPRYQMMVFLAAAQLLSDLRIFLQTNDMQTYKFFGIDGTFTAQFSKDSDIFITISVFNKLIGDENIEIFVQELWHSVSEFMIHYRPGFQDDDVGVNSMDYAMNVFYETFAHLLEDV
jgi:hypothetical protein